MPKAPANGFSAAHVPVRNVCNRALTLRHLGGCPHTGGGGGIWCLVNLAVVNLAVGNLAEAPGFRVVNLADTPRKQA